MSKTKVDRSKVGKRSKRKGKTYERRCAKILKEFTGVDFRSTPASGGFNKQGGVSIREELFCGDLISDSPNFRYCVEAKNREEFSFTALLKSPETAAFTKWWYQCITDAESVGLEPLMFFKPNNRDDFVVMSRVHWFEYFADVKCPYFELACYNMPLTFTIKEKDEKGKRVSKTVSTKLLTPVVIDWKQFVEHHDPDLMFKG